MAELRIEIEDATSGNILGQVEASQITVQTTLDKIGSFSAAIPAGQPSTAELTPGRVVRIYKEGEGSLGAFIVQETRLPAADAATISVRGPDLQDELRRKSTYLALELNNVTLQTALNTILSGSGWDATVLDPPNNTLVARFDGETLFQAVVQAARRFNLHVRADLENRHLDIGTFGSRSGLRVESPDLASPDLVSLVVERMEKLDDAGEVINSIIPVGAGEGIAQLTLERSTRTAPYVIQQVVKNGITHYYIEDADSVRVNGRYEAVLAFKDIKPLSNSSQDVALAADALYDAAVAELMWYKDPLTALALEVAKLPSAATLNVGDKIDIRWKGIVTQNGEPYTWLDVDDEFFVLARTRSIDAEGRETNRLEIANVDRQRLTDQDVVIGAIRQAQLWRTHVQAYPHTFVFDYERDLDATHPLTVSLPISNAILKVQHIKVRVEPRPVRATATAASSGGSTTTASGGGSHSHGFSGQSSSAGGSHSHSVSGQTTSSTGAHRHRVGHAARAEGTWADPSEYDLMLFYDANGSLLVETLTGHPIGEPTSNVWFYTEEQATDHSHTVSTATSSAQADHSHSLDGATTTATTPSHTHSISSHTHGLTYGIYEGTTPYNMGLKVDGTDRTGELGGPWNSTFEAEISDYLQGSLQGVHTIEISSTRLGAVHVSVEVYAIAQAIAVVA